MKLEAGKELDRKSVWDWLNDVHRNPKVAFNTYSNAQQIEFAHDAIILLKEQESVKPTINEYGEAYCICGENVGIIPRSKNLPSIRSKYCPECGKRMKWKYD